MLKVPPSTRHFFNIIIYKYIFYFGFYFIFINREEVDGIILVQLRQIGAGIPEEVTTIKTLEVEMLVDGCARCINAIVNDEEKKVSCVVAVLAHRCTSPLLLDLAICCSYCSSVCMLCSDI